MGEKSADTDEENFVKFSLYFLGMQQKPRQSATAVTTGDEEAWEEGEGVLPHRESAKSPAGAEISNKLRSVFLFCRFRSAAMMEVKPTLEKAWHLKGNREPDPTRTSLV